MPQNLVHQNIQFNTAGLENRAGAPRREFLHLGAELSNRGQQPVSQFVSELADLPPEVVAEVRARLQAYTRIDAATYAAVGADTFSPFMIVLDGGRDDAP